MTSPARHSDVLRPALLVLLGLLLALATALMAAPPAAAIPPAQVSVEDTTDSVDEDALAARLAGIEFREEVQLAVLVVDADTQGIDSSEDTALNDAVLAYARDQHPGWIEGDVWADGRVVIALDPENRLLGTYAGEDVKLSGGGFDAVQEEMRDPARDGDWEQALTVGAEKYAALLGRPWWQSPGVIIAALAAAVTTIVGVIGLLAARRAARRRVSESRQRWRQVQLDHAPTEAAARTLPEESVYADAVLEQHRRYRSGLERAHELDWSIPEHLPPAWGLRGSQRRASKDFAEQVERLDAADDDIVAANDLLHRIGSWRSAWDRELQPLRDSLEAVEGALMRTAEHDDRGPGSPAAATTRHALRSACEQTQQEMNRLTEELESDRITPDDALAGLDELTAELSRRARAVQELEISTLAEDEDEAEALREIDDEELDMRPYGTVRERRHRLVGASPSADAFWHISPVLWLSSWNSHSTEALETHRSPAAGTGATGTTGYSGSSFSGAGSSSSF